MVRFENLIPKLVNGRFENDGNDLIFHPSSNDRFREPQRYNASDSEFIRSLNGSLSISEIWSFLFKKGKKVRFDRCINILKNLAGNNLLENSDEVSEHIGLVESKANGAIKTPGSNHYGNAPHFDKSYFSKDRIIHSIKRSTLFHHTAEEDVLSLYKYSRLEEFERGTIVIENGQVEKDLYIVLSGHLGVFDNVQKNNRSVLAVLDQYKVFGESSAILNKPRTADVVGLTKGWALKVNIHKVVDVKKQASFDHFKSLKTRVLINQILAMNPLFSGIPSDVMQLFIKSCHVNQYEPGQVVFEQGQASDSFYFVLNGTVDILKDDKCIASLTKGDHFGELGVLDQKPRNATIKCPKGATLMKLSAEDFYDVLSSNIALGLLIEQSADQRRTTDLGDFDEFTTTRQLADFDGANFELDTENNNSSDSPKDELTFTNASATDFSAGSEEEEGLSEEEFSSSSYNFDEDLGASSGGKSNLELDTSALDITRTEFEIESLDFSEFSS